MATSLVSNHHVSLRPMSDGFREAQNISVWVLNVEVKRARWLLSQSSGDGRAAARQLLVEQPNVADGDEGVEVLSRSAVSSFSVKFRGALEVDRSAITRYACVEIAVNEVGCKTEALLILVVIVSFAVVDPLCGGIAPFQFSSGGNSAERSCESPRQIHLGVPLSFLRLPVHVDRHCARGGVARGHRATPCSRHLPPIQAETQVESTRSRVQAVRRRG